MASVVGFLTGAVEGIRFIHDMVVEHSWRGQTGGSVERETCRHPHAANDRVLRYFRVQRSRNHGSISLLGPGLQQEDPQERE